MRKYAKGILEIRLRISASDMLKRIIPKPSYEEQCRISDFLDKKCAEIDAVIAKTSATIEEYKQRLKEEVDFYCSTGGLFSDILYEVMDEDEGEYVKLEREDWSPISSFEETSSIGISWMPISSMEDWILPLSTSEALTTEMLKIIRIIDNIQNLLNLFIISPNDTQ